MVNIIKTQYERIAISKKMVALITMTGFISALYAMALIDSVFAVEQKYSDLMNSYVTNVTEQIMVTEGYMIDNYVDYIENQLEKQKRSEE